MIDEEACRWAARLDRGLDEKERDVLSDWLASDTRKRGALLRAQAALSVLDRARALGGEEKDWDETPPEAETPVEEDLTEDWEVQPRSRRQVLRFGGGIAAMLVTGLAWRLWPGGQRYATATGEIRRLPLEDGSLAVVNSASKLRVAFTTGRRDIELSQGEAWFQVAKNRARPFTVVSGPVRVQAVGTAFDVRRRDGFAEIVVTEGVVKIWTTGSGSDRDPLMVRAGHRAMIGDKSGVEVTEISATGWDQQLAWREGRIVLDDLTLAAAAEEFNRYTETRLEVSPGLADRRVVGWFRTDDLDGFVKASATLVGGRVEHQAGVIRIVE